jgi:hypothetical protein
VLEPHRVTVTIINDISLDDSQVQSSTEVDENAERTKKKGSYYAIFPENADTYHVRRRPAKYEMVEIEPSCLGKRIDILHQPTK